MGIEVILTGPLFDGKAEAIATTMGAAISTAVAEAGVPIVQIELDRVLQHPTGYYRSHIAVTSKAPTSATISDGGVIYGPWLAGVGSRNATTRFKGYQHWRRATARLKVTAKEIANRVVAEYTKEMN